MTRVLIALVLGGLGGVAIVAVLCGGVAIVAVLCRVARAFNLEPGVPDAVALSDREARRHAALLAIRDASRLHHVSTQDLGLDDRLWTGQKGRRG